MRRFNYLNTFTSLFLKDLLMKLFHFGPMQFWPETMLSVVSIVKPYQVVPFVVGTDAPSNRIVRIAAIVKEIAVQIGAALSQVIEGKKEKPKFPIQYKANANGCTENDDFNDPPPRIYRIFSFNFPVDRLGIFSEIT
jgi:hypothetical protein